MGLHSNRCYKQYRPIAAYGAKAITIKGARTVLTGAFEGARVQVNTYTVVIPAEVHRGGGREAGGQLL